MGLNVKKFNSRTFGNLRLHIDPEERRSHGHDNKDIDVTKTDQNYSFGCSSWDECTEALRKRNDEVDRMIPPQRLRSDRVIAVNMYMIACLKNMDLKMCMQGLYM